MPDESQQPKVILAASGRDGARLRAAGEDAPEGGEAEDRRPRTGRAPADPEADGDAEDAPHPMLRFSTNDLRAELARRQRQVEYLKLQRGALLRQVSEVEAQIARLSPSGRSPAASPRAQRTPHARAADNPVSLADALAGVVSVGEGVSPAQAAERVLAAGYHSNAQRFGVLVATALSKDKRFERIGRGQYRRTA